MIGVDIVKISRFENKSEKFISRVYSKREIEELNLKNGQNKSEYLASRFASKEAYLKASGKMTTKLSSIEALNDSNGKPHLFVNNEEVGEVSISHDTFAIAVVLLNKE